jgi:hypothetical protein
MPMPPYPLFCYQKGCGKPAIYKIAACWSDGVTGELKAYGLTCAECLPEWFRRACHRQAVCRLTLGEILEPPGIYLIQRGQGDSQLKRLTDLENQLRGQ